MGQCFFFFNHLLLHFSWKFVCEHLNFLVDYSSLSITLLQIPHATRCLWGSSWKFSCSSSKSSFLMSIKPRSNSDFMAGTGLYFFWLELEELEINFKFWKVLAEYLLSLRDVASSCIPLKVICNSCGNSYIRSGISNNSIFCKSASF